jgi:ubiquinone/menaquinone biosynthesis C-methylase UbiE
MKDNFSTQSDRYARYRPSYPAAFYTYLKTLINGTENAWDCATGNGQVAAKISDIFTNVYATDISLQQISNAIKRPNIHYSIQAAERTDFENDFFDLVIVAQAVHWFDFPKFYFEVERTGRANAILAVIGYSNLKTDPRVEKTIENFYHNIVGIYWDQERRYVEESYKTIPFPFPEIHAPQFESVYEWTFEHMLGYLSTWSAVKHYIKRNGNDPIELIKSDLADAWGNDEKKIVRFPLITRIGRVNVRQ